MAGGVRTARARTGGISSAADLHRVHGAADGLDLRTILPLAKELHVAAINWGFVQGKSQTYIPWDSWKRPYVEEQPPVWFHDVLYPDGRPYREREAEILREETGRGSPEK